MKWIGVVAVLLIGVTLGATAVYGSPEAALARLRGDSLLVEPHLDLGAGKPGSLLEANAIIRNVSDHPVRLVGGIFPKCGTGTCNAKAACNNYQCKIKLNIQQSECAAQ